VPKAVTTVGRDTPAASATASHDVPAYPSRMNRRVAAETIASRVRRADSSRTRERYGRGLDSLSMSAYYPPIHNTVMMVNGGGAL